MNASVIIFINQPIPQKHIEIANKYGIILLAYNQNQLFPSFLRTYHPSSLRWILFDWLFAIKNQYYRQYFDYILTLDVHDSVFQTDPFLLFQEEDSKSPSSTLSISNSTKEDIDSRMFVFGENQNISIATCNWNMNWIKNCFSERIYSIIKSQPIVCSGISMGSTVKMLDYFNKMSQIMAGNSSCFSNKFPRCEYNGVDQGVHNVLVHLDQLGPLKIQYSESFPLVNLQSIPELGSHLKSNEPETMNMNKLGRKFAVVQQYDRDPQFQMSLAKKYLRWIDWTNPLYDWMQTPSCTKYFGVTRGVDMLKGKCSLIDTRAMTAATCCDICVRQREEAQFNYYQESSSNDTFDMKAIKSTKYKDRNITSFSTLSLKLCTSFTFLAGICYMKSCPIQDIQAMVTLLSNTDVIDLTIINKDAISGYLKHDNFR